MNLSAIIERLYNVWPPVPDPSGSVDTTATIDDTPESRVVWEEQ